MLNRGHKRIERLIMRLLESEAQPQEIYSCPECGGRLHIQFEAYTRNERRILGVRAGCDTCHAAISMDCGEPLPRWLSSTDSRLGTPLKPRRPTNRFHM